MEVKNAVSVADFPHQHCESCFRNDCAGAGSASTTQSSRNGLRQGSRCAIEPCDRCGIRMHVCKKEDHQDNLCREVEVACINAGNGCDMLMKRRLLAKHLEECPASVVICSVEWNRWPLHHVDKQWPLPFFLPNPPGNATQLDIALALRDQAALNAAYAKPARFRRLRNELTERFPPVPLPRARHVPQAILKERQLQQQLLQQSNAKEGVGSNGTVKSLSRVGSVESDSTSNLTSVSEEEISWSDAPWQRRRNPPGLARSLCYKLCPTAPRTDNLKAALQEMSRRSQETDENGEEGMEEWSDEEGHHWYENGDAVHERLNENHGESDRRIEEVSSPTTDCATEVPSSPMSPVPPAPPLHFPLALGLNIIVETITRYQTKPKSMLTFVCGQTFRRNEYAAHYKNVHSEIHGGLTWLEQRCPLAQYGCPYSLRRLLPASPCGDVIHSTDLQSFGVKNRPFWPPAEKDESGVDKFSQLPAEILARIGYFLDGFSLNNLSRTSRRCRQVCLGLLEKQGMVQQEWIKVQGRWKIGFQRWTFSTGFEEILKWRVVEMSTGQHLKTCQFFHRLRATLPIELPIPGVKSVPVELLDRIRSAAVHDSNAADEILEPDCQGWKEPARPRRWINLTDSDDEMDILPTYDFAQK